MMQEQITDKSSVAYQRISWETLKKSINGLVNKVNVSNIIPIVRELFQENIVRGRGLLVRSILLAQGLSPTFTHVYAALVSIINTKFPQIGELLLRRVVIQFKKGFRRNDKALCLTTTRIIAHLVNQQVAHEVLTLEILTLLMENPTDDSVEVAVGFLKECGSKLTEVSPRGMNAIFEQLRNILHEGKIGQRVQYMLEVMFAIRKDGFKDHPALMDDLDLVEEADQFTHLMTLEEAKDSEDLLNVFRADPSFLDNEEKYKALKKEILDESSSDDGSGSGSGSGSDDSEDEEEDEEAKQTIIDNTETNLVALRRTIYLTVQSSLDFEECAHKMLKMELKPGQEVELCNMILDCCAQLRTYEKFFGLLAQRFCQLDKKYVDPFQTIFIEQYETIHRLETNKLRNVSKFFAHLLLTDAISWGVISCIKLNEDDTTSASRIFIKILFQELSEFMGLPKLNDRLKDQTLQNYFEGILPRDNPRNTRFAINFFTTIGLGGLTDDLRDHLKSMTKQLMQQKQEQEAAEAESESSDSSSNSSSQSSSSSSDSSDSSDADSESSSSESDNGNFKRKKKTKRMSKERSNHVGKHGKNDDNTVREYPRGSDKRRSRDKFRRERKKGEDVDVDRIRQKTENSREERDSRNGKQFERTGKEYERIGKEHERTGKGYERSGKGYERSGKDFERSEKDRLRNVNDIHSKRDRNADNRRDDRNFENDDFDRKEKHVEQSDRRDGRDNVMRNDRRDGRDNVMRNDRSSSRRDRDRRDRDEKENYGKNSRVLGRNGRDGQ